MREPLSSHFLIRSTASTARSTIANCHHLQFGIRKKTEAPLYNRLGTLFFTSYDPVLPVQTFKMVICNCILKMVRRPTRLIMISAVVFVCLGTFYWSLWEIPWLADSTEDQAGDDDAWVVSAENEPKAPLRPLPPVCIKESFPIVPKNRYCSWNTTLQDCYETLMPTFHKQPSWVFLGDAGMANIPYFLSVQWPVGNLTINTRRNPCQNLIYYGLPPPNDGWKAPNSEQGEGPAGLGKERPYCMDCTNCWNVGMTSGTQADDLSVEYLVVEYARDVSLPSRVTKTTQETAAFYLGRKPPSVCVASAGLNDAAIQPPVTQELYLQNADKYLGLLQRTCKHVIWLSLHAVVEGDDIVPTNCKLQQWKNAFLGLIEMRDYDNVYVLDIWDKSFHADFHNPTRLGQRFYASLSRLFKSLMAGPDLANNNLN